MRSRDHSICLYRRSAGGNWWRVDATVTETGAVVIVSGDDNEWTASVAPEHATDLLLALRRHGDLAPSIGAPPAIEILHRLRDLFYRPPDAHAGAFEDIKAFLDANGVAWTGSFRASDLDEDDGSQPKRGLRSPPVDLADALGDLRCLLARPGNDYSWSSWPDGRAATAELDTLIAEATDNRVDMATILTILAPSGPAQEVSLASGWSAEFLDLAARIEQALEEGGP
jgi:hypothetical protein